MKGEGEEKTRPRGRGRKKRSLRDKETGTYTEPRRSHLEPNMVLQSDAIEEPYLVPHRTFQTRVL